MTLYKNKLINYYNYYNNNNDEKEKKIEIYIINIFI